ncbi:hypothetical protein [Dactylosporangium sp. CA-139066]|uniref:hypothetical protein n=1 Tax=Dactylosporangium sp. CA-139066 TaxID=3239930 RepID=UPI003D924B23
MRFVAPPTHVGADRWPVLSYVRVTAADHPAEFIVLVDCGEGTPDSPDGHRWTFLDHTCLLDQSGTSVAFSDLFGRRPGAPRAACRDYLASDNGRRDDPCPCESRSTIYGPTCDQRCRVELAAVPTDPVRGQR